MKEIAFICNEPTPYRLALLKRLADEQPMLRVHTIFTHTIDSAHVPWQMDLSIIPRTVYFEHEALGKHNTLQQERRLAQQIIKYIKSRNIRMVILNGYGVRAHLVIMRWAKKNKVNILLRGDANIYSRDKKTGLRHFLKRRTLRWISRQIAGLMPMGRCGQAFFDHWMGPHNLPSFLCPYEPDYRLIRQCGARRCSDFLQQSKLVPTRKRLLYCGRLIDIKNQLSFLKSVN